MSKQVRFCYKNYVPVYEIGSSFAALVGILFVLFMTIGFIATQAQNLYDIGIWLFSLLIIGFCLLIGYMNGIAPWLYPRQPDILVESDGISIQYRSTWHKFLWREIRVARAGMIIYHLYGIPPKLTVESPKLPMAYYIYDKKLIRRHFWITQDIENYAQLEEYLFRGVADGRLTDLE